jgi:hypothetical protein
MLIKKENLKIKLLEMLKTKVNTIKNKELLSEKYSDGNANELVYIHVGKCGGASLWKSIKCSPVIKKHYQSVKKIHIRKPYYQKNSKYLIVIRNPIARAISAFNWRYKLVVDTKKQEFRFTGEYEILKKYRHLSNLAENLYTDNRLNLPTVKEWLAIHHLKEDIDFYVSNLLDNIEPNQIFAVLAQENLNEDILNLLGVDQTPLIHENKINEGVESLTLSPLAEKNLKVFLKADYEAIQKLNQLYPIKKENLEKLLR